MLPKKKKLLLATGVSKSVAHTVDVAALYYLMFHLSEKTCFQRGC
jgi:hypothetical protein